MVLLGLLTPTMIFQSTHPVRGGTRNTGTSSYKSVLFQSTHPVRGGTNGCNNRSDVRRISIHPPREGWDLGHIRLLIDMVHFNPPTP